MLADCSAIAAATCVALPCWPSRERHCLRVAKQQQSGFVFVLTDDQDLRLDGFSDAYTEHGSLAAMPIVRQRLMGEGAQLTNFFANTPICCPSRTEFLSGRYFHNVGPPSDTAGKCMHADTSFASSNTTGLFGTLTRHGYNTGVFGKVTNDQQHILDALVAANSATYIDSPIDYNTFNGKPYFHFNGIDELDGDAARRRVRRTVGHAVPDGADWQPHPPLARRRPHGAGARALFRVPRAARAALPGAACAVARRRSPASRRRARPTSTRRARTRRSTCAKTRRRRIAPVLRTSTCATASARSSRSTTSSAPCTIASLPPTRWRRP